MKYKRFIIYLLLACLLVLLRAPLFDWWCGSGAARLLAGIKPSLLNDIMAVLIAVIASGFAIVIPKRLSDAGNRWLGTLAIGLAFLVVLQIVEFNDCFIHLQRLPWFRYSDAVIVPLVLFFVASLVETRKKPSPENGQHQKCDMYYDNPNEVDFLGRERLVANIHNRLLEEKGNQNGAMGVSISGGWGSGKSWMLSQLKDKLEQSKEVCVDFKPWLYGDADMTRQFYLSLEQQLKSKHIRIEELKQAVTEIDNDRWVGFGKALLSFFGLVTNGDGREKTVENIKARLKELNARIYVFIDDCDRLAQKELVQVLSIVRNTGDLPGITYIMAFDKEVVEKVIGQEMGLSYVNKMFNLPIDLPPVSDDVLARYLNDATRAVLKEDADFKPFSRIAVTKYLPTVREAKRFLNLFTTDCKRLEDRFEHYYMNPEDFCLLELLKYKYPDLYYHMQSNPQAYFIVENKGWNSPAYVVLRNNGGVPADALGLLKNLFGVVEDLSNPNEVVGLANKEYYPLYFDQEPDVKYVEGEELKRAVEEHVLPQKIGEWTDAGCSGVLSMLCAVHNGLSRQEVFRSMAVYLWHVCEREKRMNSIDDITYGYINHPSQHGFRKTMEWVESIPQLELLASQHLDEDDEEDKAERDGVEQLIESSEYTMELLAIWLNKMNTAKDGDYPFDVARYYVELLWKKAVEQLDEGSISTQDVMDIWATSTLADTFKTMVFPLVTKNPQRWLGATVAKVKDADRDYYLPKSRWLHAIFGSYEKLNEELDEIEKAVRKEDFDYVKAYRDMLFGVSSMTVNKNDPNIPELFKQPYCITTDRLSSLGSSAFLGVGPVMPIKAAIRKLKDTPFWSGKDLRIHREEPRYYFGTEI